MSWPVRIDKIELCGFSSIKAPTSLVIGKNFNVIYGTLDDHKATICLAIEFMLSYSYEPDVVALTCLPAGVDGDNYGAYVTLHLSSVKAFKLNRKQAKQFAVTRYLRRENVCNVYYGSRKSLSKKQSIEKFHAELSALNLVWLDDPLVSQRIRATSDEMRQMMMKALGSQHLLKDVRHYHEKYEAIVEPLAKLLMILERSTDEERSFLTKVRSLEMVLLTKKISALRAQNPNALDYGDMDKNCEKCLLVEYVEDLETAQKQRLEVHNQAIDDALALNFGTDAIDTEEPQAILIEFSAALERYREEMDADRKEHWVNEENNQMIAMRAGLSEYFADAAGVSAEDKAICQKAIGTVDHQLNTVLHTTQNVQRIETQTQKIQSDLINIVNSMGGLVEHLDVVTQNILNEKSKSLYQARDYFDCTNELDWAEVYIKKFFVRQTIIHQAVIDTWQKGLSILTHKAAYEKRIVPGFQGNPFDFITIPTEEGDLAYVSAVIPYFATFFFGTSANVREFEGLIKSVPEKDSHLYACSIEQFDPVQIDELPYTSLADILLSDETRQNPLAKSWFDQFRVAPDDIDADEIHEEAVLMNCRILHENCCYSEDGSVRELCHRLSMDVVASLVRDWKQCAGVRERKVRRQSRKYLLENRMDKQANTMSDLETERSEACFQISASMSTISSGISKSVELAHLSIETSDLELSQTVMLNVLREQLRFFEAGIEDLEIGEINVRQIADDQPNNRIIDTIEKFKNSVGKITNILCADEMPERLVDAVIKFETDIQECRLIETNLIDFKNEISEIAKPQMNQWPEYLRSIVLSQMEWRLMHKLCLIRMHPKELIDRNLVAKYERLEINQLAKLKDKHFGRQPEDLVLTDLNIDVDLSNECCWFIEDNLPLLTEFPPDDDESNEIETTFSGIFLDRLVNALHILNEMIILRDENETVGMELSTADNSVDIFHDAIDPQWCQQFPMHVLRHSDTELRFITKTDRRSDLLDINSNRYCSYFHLTFSLSMQLSLVILNNSIIGMPSDEFGKLIELLEARDDVEKKQIVVVQRDSNYDIDSLETVGFQLICCGQDDVTFSNSS